jgi:hypothetical protein
METSRSVRFPAIARRGQLAAGAGGVFDGEVGPKNWSYCSSARMIR